MDPRRQRERMKALGMRALDADGMTQRATVIPGDHVRQRGQIYYWETIVEWFHWVFASFLVHLSLLQCKLQRAQIFIDFVHGW